MSDPKTLARELALNDYVTGVFHAKSFDKDFALFTTTRKMIDRFLRTGLINEKLMINNTVVLLNIFGCQKVSRVFRVLLNDVQFSVIKAMLMFLHQYDWSVAADVWPNRIIVDILKHVANRYNLEHL